jgi:hypothetical protein
MAATAPRAARGPERAGPSTYGGPAALSRLGACIARAGEAEPRLRPARSYAGPRRVRPLLTARGAAGGETFDVWLKDRAGKEQRVPSETAGEVSADEWRKLSVRLRDLEVVDLGSPENVSVGFGQPHGSGEICIDEITFEGTGPAPALRPRKRRPEWKTDEAAASHRQGLWSPDRSACTLLTGGCSVWRDRENRLVCAASRW